MKKYWFLLLFVLGGWQVENDESEWLIKHDNLVDVEQSPGLKHVLKPKFMDGTLVEENQLVTDVKTGKAFLVQKGHNKSNGDCRLTRMELIKGESGLNPVLDGIFETCWGKDCSHCVFKEEGGCKCIKDNHICEHIITRTPNNFDP